MAAPAAHSSSRSIALQRVSGDLWKVLAVIAILAILLLRTDLAYSHSKSTAARDTESTAIRGRSRVLSGSAGDSEPLVVEDTAHAQTAQTAALNCPAQRSSFSRAVQEGSKGLKDAPPVSSDECAAALHLPKLALLFLTVGSLPHDKLWSDWFASAKGKPLPAPCLRLCGILQAEICLRPHEAAMQTTLWSCMHLQYQTHAKEHESPCKAGQGCLPQLRHVIQWSAGNLNRRQAVLMDCAFLIAYRPPWHVLDLSCLASTMSQ